MAAHARRLQFRYNRANEKTGRVDAAPSPGRSVGGWPAGPTDGLLPCRDGGHAGHLAGWTVGGVRPQYHRGSGERASQRVVDGAVRWVGAGHPADHPGFQRVGAEVESRWQAADLPFGAARAGKRRGGSARGAGGKGRARWPRRRRRGGYLVSAHGPRRRRGVPDSGSRRRAHFQPGQSMDRVSEAHSAAAHRPRDDAAGAHTSNSASRAVSTTG